MRGTGAIMSVLTGRHVVTQREIVPSGGGDIHTPEKITRGASPSNCSSAPRSATAVSWLHMTRMASEAEGV